MEGVQAVTSAEECVTGRVGSIGCTLVFKVISVDLMPTWRVIELATPSGNVWHKADRHCVVAFFCEQP